MKRFEIEHLPLPDLKRITRNRFGDKRGFLERLFCAIELREAGWGKPIVQVNQTYTARKGTVRGMHYQHPPYAESKLVTCISGAVWDVAVDLRPESPTFLQWHAEELSHDNRRSLLIPAGFAHGFQTLTDDVVLIYCHDNEYNPSSETGLNPTDPRLNIRWPLPISVMSDRDLGHPMLTTDYAGVRL